MTILAKWQPKLATGVPKYRINGSYDAPATGRRERRILERMARKAIAQAKKKGAK